MYIQIHRDIKPSNMMLLADMQTIKLIAFGLSLLGKSLIHFANLIYPSDLQIESCNLQIESSVDIQTIRFIDFELSVLGQSLIHLAYLIYSSNASSKVPI